MKWNLKILISVLLLVSAASQTRADIYEWAWVNPSNPSQGVVQSSVVCPGGSGVSAVPNANLAGLDLTQAYLPGANLTGAALNYTTLTNADLANANLSNAYLYFATLTNANLSNANLTNANLESATLTNANLTGAIVAGVTFVDPHRSDIGITASQLYSTASYQGQNLQGINLENYNLTGWNFSGQNLTNALLHGATLTNARLTNANLTSGTLNGANVTSGTLTKANLTNASLSGVTLTKANLTGATVTGANFEGSNLTISQLYSTASYQAQNLQGINLESFNLTGWDFSRQNLANANLSYGTLTNANLTGATVAGANFEFTTITESQFYCTGSYHAQNLEDINLAFDNLVGWDFSGQNLSNANFNQANSTNANFSGADLRGEYGLALDSGNNATNTILAYGTIQGLSLSSNNPTLLVRNYSGGSIYNGGSYPIHILQGMSMSPGTSLVFQFDGNPWDSRILFAAGIPVALGGNIELGLAPGTNPAALLGQSLQLFDWTGVSPSGQFAQVVSDLPTRYSWNTSALYTLGQVALTLSPTSINGQWAYNGSGAWSGAANWSGGNVPGAPQDTAVFGTALTSGTASVTLDTFVSLASLTFSPTGGAYYVINPSSFASTLILSNTAGPATIINKRGNNTIATPITLESNFGASVSAGSALTITGAISEGGSSCSLILNGGGLLILSVSNGFSGGTAVSGGMLQLGNASALGAGGLAADAGVIDLAGNSLTVSSLSGAAGTITNSGSVDSLLTVSQSGTTTFGGSLSDGTTNQLALSLTGPGTLILSGSSSYTGGTTVSDGTLILTNSEALGDGTSLTVGAGAPSLFDTSPGNVSAAASPSMAAVPEPGTLMLLAAALWSATASRRFPKRAGIRLARNQPL
jgi:autotransporter-associated beta strand protein